MRDPSKFYDEQKHRRLMPKQDLSEQNIADLIALYVRKAGWEPQVVGRGDAALALLSGLGIPVVDHIVVSDHGFVSMAELGLIKK